MLFIAPLFSQVVVVDAHFSPCCDNVAPISLKPSIDFHFAQNWNLGCGLAITW
jgi:hypothetical protein